MQYKFGKISYINSIPLFCANSQNFEMVEDCPARLNELAEKKELDISLISRWIYPSIEKDYAVIPEICISGDGTIMSVELFTKRPIELLQNGTLFITAETGTSSKAFGYLVARKYGLDLLSLERAPYETADAVLLIGNSALAFSNSEYPYKYDLGEMWKEVVGNKMIYAIAVARRDIYDSARKVALDYFNESLEKFEREKESQLAKISAIFERQQKVSISCEKLAEYYTKLIYKLPEKDFWESFNFVKNLYANELV
ncbi:MAG: hypothetical protein J6K91_04670 [Opitutales bacterium]|nr:hypothetical protein [Opitutales bacterium]